jgi:hypothetical protein
VARVRMPSSDGKGEPELLELRRHASVY